MYTYRHSQSSQVHKYLQRTQAPLYIWTFICSCHLTNPLSALNHSSSHTFDQGDPFWEQSFFYLVKLYSSFPSGSNSHVFCKTLPRHLASQTVYHSFLWVLIVPDTQKKTLIYCSVIHILTFLHSWPRLKDKNCLMLSSTPTPFIQQCMKTRRCSRSMVTHKQWGFLYAYHSSRLL